MIVDGNLLISFLFYCYPKSGLQILNGYLGRSGLGHRILKGEQVAVCLVVGEVLQLEIGEDVLLCLPLLQCIHLWLVHLCQLCEVQILCIVTLSSRL